MKNELAFVSEPPRKWGQEIEHIARFPEVFKDGKFMPERARARLHKIAVQRKDMTEAAAASIRAKLTRPHGDMHDMQKWDALNSEARVFHIRDGHDAGALIGGYPSDAAPMLVAPFPIFSIVLDAKALYEIPQRVGGGDDGAIDIKRCAVGEWVVDATATPWLVYERNKVFAAYHPGAAPEKIYEDIRDAVSGEYSFYVYSEGIALDPETGEIDESKINVDAPFKSAEGKTAEGPMLTGPHLVRAFCAFANHIDVSAVITEDPERPPTRQQRRAQKYIEREHYRVVIRGKVDRIAREIAQGKNVRERREHEVRGHLRHYATGRISRVRPHRRCRGVKPFIQREYEVSVPYEPEAE